jgi:hypothetical protein
MDNYYNQLKPAIDTLETLIKKYKHKNNIEIEIRIGRVEEDKFYAGIFSVNFYNKILESLNSYKNWNSVKTTDTVEYINNNIRKVNNKFISKQRIENINFSFKDTPYDFRISVSQETPINYDNFTHKIIRRKHRVSFEYKECLFELTKVEEENDEEIIENEEFEIELINLKSDTIDKYRAHSALLKIRDIINICEPILTTSHVVKLI